MHRFSFPRGRPSCSLGLALRDPARRLLSVVVVPRRQLFAVAIALLASGCVREEMVPFAYEVPIAGNRRGAEAAANCVAACRVANDENSTGFFGCLGTCPDVRIVEGAECARASTPSSVCYTELVPKEVPDDAETANVLLSLLGDIVGATVRGALASESHHEHHQGGSSHHHHR